MPCSRLAVLMVFIAMKTFGVDANIVALSGIAIAIGTMVDMGIILCENILKHLDEADPERRSWTRHLSVRRMRLPVLCLTAVSTTVVSFLPVFTMIAAEGKLFRPLAFTKTFALAASVIVALTIIPPAAHILMGGRMQAGSLRKYSMIALVVARSAGDVFRFVVGRGHRHRPWTVQAARTTYSSPNTITTLLTLRLVPSPYCWSESS